jgi:hypothetical protein
MEWFNCITAFRSKLDEAAEFYRRKRGFSVAFSYGEPPFSTLPRPIIFN